MHYIDAIIAAILIVVVGLGLTEALTRLKVPAPWIRKFAHVGISLLIIAGAFLFGYHLLIIVGSLCAVGLLIVKLVHPPKVLTGKEVSDSYGEVFYFVGIALTAAIANSLWHFVIPVAILGFADTAAYIFGKSIASPKLFRSKSLAGTSAFVIIAFLLLLLVAPWWLALLGAIVTAAAELVGLWGSDNMMVPVVATLLLYL